MLRDGWLRAGCSARHATPSRRARSLRSYRYRAGRAGGRWNQFGPIGFGAKRLAAPARQPAVRRRQPGEVSITGVSRPRSCCLCPGRPWGTTSFALVNTVVRVCSKRGRYRPSDCHCRTSMVCPQFCGARTTLLLARIVQRQLARLRKITIFGGQRAHRRGRCPADDVARRRNQRRPSCVMVCAMDYLVSPWRRFHQIATAQRWALCRRHQGAGSVTHRSQRLCPARHCTTCKSLWAESPNRLRTSMPAAHALRSHPPLPCDYEPLTSRMKGERR
jgi:hypothetical protein